MPPPSTSRDLRFLDPAVIARLGTMELKARTVVEGFLVGTASQSLQGLQRRVRRVPAVPARRRSLDARLEGLRAHRSALRQEVRGGDEPRVPPAARRERVDGVPRRRADEQAGIRIGARRVAGVPDEPPARRDRPHRVRRADLFRGCRPARGPGTCTRCCSALERLQPGARSNVGRPLHQLAEALVKRSLVVLVSDLLDDPEPVIKGLKHLRFRGTDVVVFQVLDPHELTFPFRGASRFRDLESAGRGDRGPRGGADGVPARAGGADAALRPRAARRRHRLRAARHVAAARLRAARRTCRRVRGGSRRV